MQSNFMSGIFYGKTGWIDTVTGTSVLLGYQVRGRLLMKTRVHH
jgi:hypothetical protein